MERKGLFRGFILFIVAVLVASVALAADPLGPDEITEISNSRRSEDTDGRLLKALAGNVTELFVTDSSITQGWQGYYGNVSGNIVGI